MVIMMEVEVQILTSRTVGWKSPLIKGDGGEEARTRASQQLNKSSEDCHESKSQMYAVQLFLLSFPK